MITTKIEGFGELSSRLERMSRDLQSLDGQQIKLTCNCGSTEFLVDDELGETAPARCKICGKVIGTKADLEALVVKQAEAHMDAAVKSALGG